MPLHLFAIKSTSIQITKVNRSKFGVKIIPSIKILFNIKEKISLFYKIWFYGLENLKKFNDKAKIKLKKIKNHKTYLMIFIF